MTTEAIGTQHELTDIEFRSDMTVDLIRSQAADENVVWAARVSTAGDLTLDSLAEDPTRSEGLIRYLLRSKRLRSCTMWQRVLRCGFPSKNLHNS